jgi:hypothetical protein
MMFGVAEIGTLGIPFNEDLGEEILTLGDTSLSLSSSGLGVVLVVCLVDL